MTRLLPRIALVALAGLFLFLLQGAFANATSTPPGCTLYTGHSGHLPDQYDYGIFIEYSPPVEIRSTHSEDPRDYNAGSRWDVVLKCKTPATTTTTTPSTTTTSIPPTTTTVPPTTTTQPPTTTTTEPPTTTTQPPETTTTTAPVSTTQPPTPTTTIPEVSTDIPELPYTGAGEVLAVLALVGVALTVLGGLALRASRIR